MKTNNMIHKRMKKVTSVLFALLSVLFVSCEQIEDFSQETTALRFTVSDFPAFGEGAATGAIGLQDAGKTAWENGNKILVHLYSNKYGHQAVTLRFENGDWKSDGGTLSYLKDENPTITAVYAPDCEIKSDKTIGLLEGRKYGMAEYILAKTTIIDQINVMIADIQAELKARKTRAEKAGAKEPLSEEQIESGM